MSKFLDSIGLTTLWNIIKSTFASSLSFSNRTLTLKNKDGDTLSTVELPYRGIYFVKGTQTAATGTWVGALPEVESLYDGLTIAYFLPYAGSGDATLTLTLKNSTTQAEPVYYNNSSRATTHYGAGATVVLTWISNATSGYTAVGSATGRWTRADYNSNTYTSAVCTTAAATAEKTATCTDYALLSNSYVHVLIKNSNTVKSALTLSINGKTAKPIYINGTASSASNYTLPAGTYIVFYDGTNYYFNTNGNLPGHIDVNTISSVLGVVKGGTGKNTLDSGKALIGNGTDPVTLRDIYTRTDQGSLEWSSATNEYLVTKGALAYWNGAYGTGGTSNIKKLGTIDTGVWQGTKIGVAYGGTGQTTAKDASNAFINALDTETTALQDGDYFIAQTAGGGTTTTTYKRKALSLLSDYIEDKIGGNYLPLAGGQMTGPLTWKNGTALPAKTSDINYLLTIDSFSDGGTTKYATIANVANAIAPTVETAVENDYIMLTKKSNMAIPANSDLDTYKTPGYFICDSNTTAKTISNNPTRLFNSSGAVSAAYAFVLIVRKVTNTTFHQFIYMHQPTGTSERSRVPSSWQRYFNGSAWTNWYKISSVLSNPYPTTAPTSIDFESSEQGLGGMFHFVASDSNRGSLYQMSNVLQMNWSADSGYDSQLAVGYTGRLLGFRSRSASGGWNTWNYAQFIHYGVCNSAADAQLKEVDFGNCSIDIPGTEVTVKFVNGNTHTKPKLATSNISPTATFSAGVDIFYKGAYVDSTYIKPNDVVRMVWDGTKWHIVGCINSVTSYGNHVLYHIKCTDGNDDNDGLTESTAFKTLDKFFEVTANSGYTDCRCRLDQAGTYYLNKQAANNITWHCRIGPNVDSGQVKIVGNYGVSESWIMYNSHVKLSGRYPGDYESTDTVNIPLQYIGYNPGTLQGIYFENSAVTLENVKFDCTVRTFGCYINATQGLVANRLYLYGTTGIVEDLEITSTSNGNNPAIQVWRGSFIRFSSPNDDNKSFKVANLSAAATSEKNIFLDIRDSSVVLTSKMPELTNQYYYGIKCLNAELTGKRAILGTFQTRCVAGKIAADEETELNVSWGEPAFNSLYGVESVQITTPANDQTIPANAIKTWTISKATIQAAIAVDHPYSTFPYKILAIVPSFTSDNRVIIKNALEDTSTENVTVIGRNVSSSVVPVGATATVSILYTLKPLNIIKKS